MNTINNEAGIKNMYLSNEQIHEMADAALTSYEMVADWHQARVAANEYARDEFGVVPRRSAVLLAVKLAKAGWEGRVMAVKAALS